jgi:hypothetical protein
MKKYIYEPHANGTFSIYLITEGFSMADAELFCHDIKLESDASAVTAFLNVYHFKQ